MVNILGHFPLFVNYQLKIKPPEPIENGEANQLRTAAVQLLNSVRLENFVITHLLLKKPILCDFDPKHESAIVAANINSYYLFQ